MANEKATETLFRVEQRLQQHPGGEFLDWCLIDERSGEVLAERAYRDGVVEFADALNAAYPPGSIAPAHDSLVHEIHGQSITGERPLPMWLLPPVDLATMIPCEVGDPCESELWARVLGLPDDREVA